ncbi:putative nuclease SbcCD D subunit [Erwinia phage vB_EamM_Phobos]|uniref:SbcD-like subunit of palindrome specific endonuclease n=1 Tax=Erwinia phage vB_EamM_Phobos TaxID=1883377 RepID=UPI00081C60D3|nr:SbcD-like subunit of palindrome specific endonuclease [Erwinia phage vB_EamM_Phobos]ANZ50219.1 putative nuclease SbcCD D subunit [Erwinia phage vB_EamM_Phobos]
METHYSPVAKVVGCKRVVFFGDVHLLHPRVPTWHIATNLKKLISELKNTADAIYIVGDLFDDSKHLRSDETHEALEFASWLLAWCKSTNTALRILEGTPSHDHSQSKVIPRLNIAIGADVLYLDGIGIHQDPVLDMTVGWVQDEYKTKAKETEQEMAELMKTRGIDKVDFFVMHGCFHFQLPVFSEKSFNESFWVKRAKRAIFIGHDHRPKLNGIIRVTGSPERLSMGEEEEKGINIADFSDEHTRLYFRVNTDACMQLTVRAQDNYDAHYKACLDALKRIDESPVPHVGRLKIEYGFDSPIAEHITRWKKEYIFNIKGDKLPDPKVEKLLVEAFSHKSDVEDISKDNVQAIMLAEMAQLDYDPRIVSQIINAVQ